ncbi:protein kinase [Strigomonas culicis]|uniref:Protein kinase n=1 Tax=Strigomonas culicis TaxID=28005 RepID=S9UWE3_9TRYP|nr:protein kinase [Strigomonas culicis]|eukprot:EPY18861.1 protein kinase [Strigomonas culicis]
MGTFNLRVIMDPIKTGFEDEKTFPIVRGSVVADRYQIIQLLGKATFSRAVRCYDLHQPIYAEDEGEAAAATAAAGDAAGAADTRDPSARAEQEPIGYTEVCLKIINNSKDFFDQSLDEIRLLTLINTHRNPDEAHVIRLIDAFYYKEHTMLVTELLSDNLYEYSKYNREEEEDFYFTLPRLRRIARQVTEALAYVHSLNLIHADLKPENILFLSHRRCIVKVIDFGSSCFLSDHLSSYIQSRSYRAPEVVLGCDYDGRIDVWSLGGILAELVTGDVLFPSQTVPDMLARILYVLGQTYPRQMLWQGRHTNSFINKFGCIYENGSSAGQGGREPAEEDGEEPYYIYTPVPPAKPAAAEKAKAAAGGGFVAPEPYEPYGVLYQMLANAGVADPDFFSFVKACLTIDHKKRPTSEELLSHPFIANEKL